MTCKHVLRLLSSYQDGECSAKTTAEINRHLEKCPNCRQEWNLTKQMVKELKELEAIEPVRNFELSIMTEVNSPQKSASKPIPSVIYSLIFMFFFFLGIFLTQKVGSFTTHKPPNPTMVQLLMESQQLNQLDIQEKTIQLLFEKEIDENEKMD